MQSGAVRTAREPVLQRPGDGLLDEAAPAGTGRTVGAAAALKKPLPGLAMDLDSGSHDLTVAPAPYRSGAAPGPSGASEVTVLSDRRLRGAESAELGFAMWLRMSGRGAVQI
jgi:hypothetical protein